jgi:hypothetical protein
MGPIRLMSREMLRRPAGLLLSVAAVAVAVAVPIMTATVSGGLGGKVEATAAYIRAGTKRLSWEIADDARRILRDMGVNLVLLHESNKFQRYKDRRFPQPTMPEAYVRRIADTPGIVADHYIGRLQLTALATKAGSDDPPQDVVVSGNLPELGAVDRGPKAPLPMAFNFRRKNWCYLGQDVADALGVRPRQRITLQRGSRQVTLQVMRIFDADDLKVLQVEGDTVYMHLHTAQELLGDRQKIENQVITAIEALSCRCATGVHPADFIMENRKRVRAALPDVRVHVMQNIWQAREKLRREVEQKGKKQETVARQGGESVRRDFQTFFGLISVVLVAACGSLVGLLMVANVRERRSEVGVLLAVGWRPTKVGTLFGSKAVVLGLLGGLVGVGVGLALAAGTSGMFAAMVPQTPPPTAPATAPARQPATQPTTVPATASTTQAAAAATQPDVAFRPRPSIRRGPPVPKPPAENRLDLKLSPLLLILGVLLAPVLTLCVSTFAIVKATHTDPALILAQR